LVLDLHSEPVYLLSGGLIPKANIFAVCRVKKTLGQTHNREVALEAFSWTDYT